MKEQTEPFTSGDNDISTVPSHGWNRHFCVQETCGSSKHLTLIVPRGRHFPSWKIYVWLPFYCLHNVLYLHPAHIERTQHVVRIRAVLISCGMMGQVVLRPCLTLPHPQESAGEPIT